MPPKLMVLISEVIYSLLIIVYLRAQPSEMVRHARGKQS